MSNMITTDRLIREKECAEITGLARTTRWELEQRGEFPRRVKISARASGWRLSQLQTWLESKTPVAG